MQADLALYWWQRLTTFSTSRIRVKIYVFLKQTEELVKNLTGFMEYLTKEQHKHVAGSQVIWYDSVLNTGELDWQNALNDKNRYIYYVLQRKQSYHFHCNEILIHSFSSKTVLISCYCSL